MVEFGYRMTELRYEGKPVQDIWQNDLESKNSSSVYHMVLGWELFFAEKIWVSKHLC